MQRRIVARDITLATTSFAPAAKRPRRTDAADETSGDTVVDDAGEVWPAIGRLRALFPSDSFQPGLPHIVLKHQLYSLLSGRVQRGSVDLELQRLRDSRRVRLFKIGGETDERFALLTAAEFEEFARARRGSVSDAILSRYLTLVLRETADLSLSPGQHLPFSDPEISELVQSGFLTVRDYGCYWVACPDMGRFIGVYRKSRARVMRILRRIKFKEMLHSDLEARLPHLVPPLEYMLHDLVGDGSLRSVDTTSGKLYRLP